MLSRKIFSLLVLVLFITTTCLYLQVNAQTRRLSGKVLDQNREAIGGAQVVVAQNNSDFGVSTTTNERGEFSLEVHLLGMA